jgi:hypothetical protein
MRLYGGIHHRFDNDAGLALGRRIGKLTLRRLGPAAHDHLRPDVVEAPQGRSPHGLVLGRPGEQDVARGRALQRGELWHHAASPSGGSTLISALLRDGATAGES